MSRHDQTIRVFTEWSSIVGLSESDRYLIVNPFFHTFGYKAGFLACLLSGATMIPVPIFDVPTVLKIVNQEKSLRYLVRQLCTSVFSITPRETILTFRLCAWR